MVMIQERGRWLLGQASGGHSMQESVLGQEEGEHIFWAEERVRRIKWV